MSSFFFVLPPFIACTVLRGAGEPLVRVSLLVVFAWSVLVKGSYMLW